LSLLRNEVGSIVRDQNSMVTSFISKYKQLPNPTHSISCKGWFQRITEVDEDAVEESEASNSSRLDQSTRISRNRGPIASPADFQRVRILRKIAFGLSEGKGWSPEERWARVRKDATEGANRQQKEAQGKGRDSQETSGNEESMHAQFLAHIIKRTDMHSHRIPCSQSQSSCR